MSFFLLTAFWRHSTLAAMSSGLPSIIHRFAPLVAGIFFAAVLAAQAQESIEPDVLPSLAEPSASSAEAQPSTSAEPLPTLAQSSPSAPAEPLPSSAESLPSSEQAFPSTPEPLSSSTNYTTAQTSVVPAPVPAGPYGQVGKNVFPGGGTISSSEPRRFHYELRLTVRALRDDNIFISHTDRVSDYYFAIEPQLPLESATSRDATEAISGWIICPALFCSS